MNLHAFIFNEVKPALGCTEPVSVALCAAVAAQYLDGPPESLDLKMSVNIFKNGRDVGVPGTGGLRGNEMAAALGALAGRPARGLLVLEDVPAEAVERARAFLAEGRLDSEVLKDVTGVHTEIIARGGGHEVHAVVRGRHDQVWSVTRDGVAVVAPPEPVAGAKIPAPDYDRELMDMDFEAIWDLAGSIDADIEAYMHEGVEMNMKVAAEGLKQAVGLGLGKATLETSSGDDLACRVRGTTAAAADVRMAGAELPVMSSAGSGNHGITAIVPLAVVAEAEGSSPRKLAEALALSHLVTGYIKAHTGRLTPICGCSVAAGAGAAAGLVRLMGGTARQAEIAVATIISSVMGMICDGAKGACGLKVSTAAAEAFNAAKLAITGSGLTDSQGVVSTDIKTTAKAVTTLSCEAFAHVDGVLVDIMQAQNK